MAGLRIRSEIDRFLDPNPNLTSYLGFYIENVVINVKLFVFLSLFYGQCVLVLNKSQIFFHQNLDPDPEQLSGKIGIPIQQKCRDPDPQL